jgi:hypothetical protein
VNLFEAILNHVSWRSLFNAYGVLGIGLLVLGAIYIRNPTPVTGGMNQGIGEFFTSVISGMAEVAKIPHVWIASIIDAAQFGVIQLYSTAKLASHVRVGSFLTVYP